MQTLLRVLSIGRDSRLMATRQWALATRYEVLDLHNPAEIDALPQEMRFDIILLCHTISARDCSRVIEVALRRWPAAQIMGLSNGYTSRAHCSPEITIPGIAGPRALIARIEGLMSLPQAS